MRSWIFCLVGCGYSLIEWLDIMSVFRIYGYDYVVSIEYEDLLMLIDEGFDCVVINL